jgi:hypothetical protein
MRWMVTLGSTVCLIGAIAHCGGSSATIPDVDGGSSGRSSSSATSGTSGGSGTSGTSGTSGSSGNLDAGRDAGDASAPCVPECPRGRLCCGGVCVNPANDPTNCGGCGVRCSGEKSFCNETCMAPPCEGTVCLGIKTCCGTTCCGQGEICCASQGPVALPPTCFQPTKDQPTCPQGCAPLCASDRNRKEGFTPVDERAVLEGVSRLEMSTWFYKDDSRRTRHLGPMAQDFKHEFELGGSETGYDPIDAHGVALTSIKALHGIVREQNERLERLEAELARTRAECRKK